MERIISFIGLISIVALAYLFSPNKKNINWRTVFSGIFLQAVLALLILKTSPGKWFFSKADKVAMAVLDYTSAGSEFVFGSLAKFNVLAEGLGGPQHAFIFATMVLPTIIFVSSLMAVLYHLGIMQKIVEAFAWVMSKLMGLSGAESLAAAANIFAGQTEAPLVVRPYILKMTKSELMALMTGGMATVAGGVMAAYVGMGINAGHLLAASVMSAPAALICAKLLMPEVEKPQTLGIVKIKNLNPAANTIDAAASGAAEGLQLALNVGAMLMAFIALIAMFNGLLGYIGGLVGYPQLSFELITGHLFRPFAFLLGVEWKDTLIMGSLLGKKLVVNEFVAYTDLRANMANLSPRTVTIATYALCGFSNFSSIAIQVGGIGTLAPSRKKDLAKLGLRSLLGGTLACMMTATLAGILL